MGEQRWNSFYARRFAENLTRLGKFFGTDKAGPVHHYTPHYRMLFHPLRHKKFVLLEIGIGGYARSGAGGASLRMWKYYFPRAQIIGLDLQDKRFVEEDRIKVYQGDQTDADLLKRIVEENGAPRIIIDDGSHRPPHVRATFETLFPLLENGGFYAIEDTQSSYWPEWGGSDDLDAPDTTMAMVKKLVDGLNYEEYVDETYEPTYTDKNITAVHCWHNLVIMRKGRNAEGTRKRKILRKRYAPQT